MERGGDLGHRSQNRGQLSFDLLAFEKYYLNNRKESEREAQGAQGIPGANFLDGYENNHPHGKV